MKPASDTSLKDLIEMIQSEAFNEGVEQSLDWAAENAEAFIYNSIAEVSKASILKGKEILLKK